jgi:hypothetical protein
MSYAGFGGIPLLSVLLGAPFGLLDGVGGVLSPVPSASPEDRLIWLEIGAN